MARTLNQVPATLPVKRRAQVERRARELATLKHLHEAVERTQEELALSLGIGQDTISRIERRSDMQLSKSGRDVEAMGGKLEPVAEFPNRPSIVIDQLTTTWEESPSPPQTKSEHTTSFANQLSGKPSLDDLTSRRATNQRSTARVI